MGLDRHKQLQQAERLLKQGKVPAAMLELERLADSAPNDVLTLNRIGDLLAKQGRKDEAIRFYLKIAQQFSRGGFLPKAVAIHKKILRLNSGYIGSLVQLGQLYFQQKLPGEGRSYLLRAADQYLQARNFTKAREVYEHLVAAEPDDPRHRARLAEARAAEGQTAEAGEELLGLSESLFASGKPSEAEQTYRRAAELLPGRDEPLIGLARSLGEQGRGQEALQVLDQVEREHGGSPAILGERVLRYELAGRARDALEMLKLPSAPQIDDDVFVHVFRHHRDNNGLDALWQRLDPVFERWREGGDADRLSMLLGRLAELEEEGHIPALRRLVVVHQVRKDRLAMRETLENLVRACQRQSQTDDLAELMERLRAVAPDSPVLAGAAEPQAAPTPAPPPLAASEASPPAPVAPTAQVRSGDGEPPIEAEAPAVPLNRGDEEYVSGRLTQTEILEKYGLREQALQQVREVTGKFPGHVAAQEKLVELLREGPAEDELRDALIALALARRAEGDGSGAQQSCAEAAAIAPLEPGTARMLAQLGLIAGEAAPPPQPPQPPQVDQAPAPAQPAEAVAPAPVFEQPAEPQPTPVRQDPSVRVAPPEVQASSADGVVLIDFDEMDDDEAEAAAPAAAAEPAIPARTLEEREPVGAAAAAAPAVAAETEVAPLAAMPEQATEQPPAPAAIEPSAVEPPAMTDGTQLAAAQAAASTAPLGALDRAASDGLIDGMEDFASLEDDDDLSAITAALESELFADDATPIEPEPESEQSLEEVFAAFKQHVAEEVGSEDYRTHYDLGIAYKEMGLIGEAIAEFEQAVKSPELGRESYTMLALCYRERDESDAAARCYREAIASSAPDGEVIRSLRYELAELLLSSGDRKGALDEFRHVLESDPSYRDVQNRVAELESRAS